MNRQEQACSSHQPESNAAVTPAHVVLPRDLWDKLSGTTDAQAIIKEYNRSSCNQHSVQFHDSTTNSLPIATTEVDSNPRAVHGEPSIPKDSNGFSHANPLLANTMGIGAMDPTDICHVLSTHKQWSMQENSNTDSGTSYFNVHTMIYTVDNHTTSASHSLIDHGANGGLAGVDCRVLEHTD